jgi:hypothetical protein
MPKLSFSDVVLPERKQSIVAMCFCLPLSAGLAEKIQGLIDDAVSKGAKLLAGGKIPAGMPGQFYPPTVITGVKRGMRIWEEEVFGPVSESSGPCL